MDLTRNTSLDWKLPIHTWDTHMHVFDGEHYPYSPNRSYTPEDALFSSYLGFYSSLSVSKSPQNVVLVQPSPYGLDNSLIRDILLQHQKTARDIADYVQGMSLRAVIVIDPSKVTEEELYSWHELGVRGVRINIEASNVTTGSQVLRQSIIDVAAKIKKYNWKVQLYIPGSTWDELYDTLRDLPVHIIADHQGGLKAPSALPANITNVTHQSGYSSLVSLAQSGRVFIKISAFYRSSALTTGGYDDMETLIKALAQAVPEQLIWGSDWPHTGSGANRSASTVNVPEPFRKVDDAAVLKNIRKWVGPIVWRQMMIETPAKLLL